MEGRAQPPDLPARAGGRPSTESLPDSTLKTRSAASLIKFSTSLPSVFILGNFNFIYKHV